MSIAVIAASSSTMAGFIKLPKPSAAQLAAREAQKNYLLGKMNGETWGKMYRIGENPPRDQEIQAAAETVSRNIDLRGERNVQAFRDGFADGLRSAAASVTNPAP